MCCVFLINHIEKIDNLSSGKSEKLHFHVNALHFIASLKAIFQHREIARILYAIIKMLLIKLLNDFESRFIFNSGRFLSLKIACPLPLGNFELYFYIYNIKCNTLIKKCRFSKMLQFIHYSMYTIFDTL